MAQQQRIFVVASREHAVFETARFEGEAWFYFYEVTKACRRPANICPDNAYKSSRPGSHNTQQDKLTSPTHIYIQETYMKTFAIEFRP